MRRAKKEVHPPYYAMNGGPLDGLPLKMGTIESLPERFGMEETAGSYVRAFDGEFYTYVWEAG